jgi:hypothetical protein
LAETVSEEGPMDIDVLVEGEGLSDVIAIVVPAGERATLIVERVAQLGGFSSTDALLFIEDAAEPIDPRTVVDEGWARRLHHVHRTRLIEVTVFYKNLEKRREFSPATRVRSVLDWAVGDEGFKIDPAMAPEMELALRSGETPLSKSAHIGRYVHHPDRVLHLDLIRGVIPNGS